MEDPLRFFSLDIWRTLHDWPLGTLMSILLILTIIALVLLVLWGAFIAMDSWFLPRRRTTGTIAGKHYTAPYTSTRWQTIGKVSYPQTVHHPEQHELTITTNGRSDTIAVTKEYWVRAREGDEVTIEYVDGRLSGGLYIKDLFA